MAKISETTGGMYQDIPSRLKKINEYINQHNEISDEVLKMVTPKSLETYVLFFNNSLSENFERKPAIGTYFIDRYRGNSDTLCYRISFIAKDDKKIYPVSDTKENYIKYLDKLSYIESKIERFDKTPINPEIKEAEEETDEGGYGPFSLLYLAAHWGELEDVLPEDSDPKLELPLEELELYKKLESENRIRKL